MLCGRKRALTAVTAAQPTRFIRTEFHRRQDNNMSQTRDGWQTIGSYNVYTWSLSGVETCVVVKADDLKLAFDMGYSIPQSITCANVFIT